MTRTPELALLGGDKSQIPSRSGRSGRIADFVGDLGGASEEVGCFGQAGPLPSDQSEGVVAARLKLSQVGFQFDLEGSLAQRPRLIVFARPPRGEA